MTVAIPGSPGASLLIVGRRHLEHVVTAYTLHYNEPRPHPFTRAATAARPYRHRSTNQQRASSFCSTGFVAATVSAA